MARAVRGAFDSSTAGSSSKDGTANIRCHASSTDKLILNWARNVGCTGDNFAKRRTNRTHRAATAIHAHDATARAGIAGFDAMVVALGIVATAQPSANGAALAAHSRRRHNQHGCQDQEFSHNTISIPKGSPHPHQDTRGPHNSTSRQRMCKF